MAELGTVTRALLAGGDDGVDAHAVAERICRACVAGLDVDGAVISVLTATVSRETLWATDPTAQLLEELQFTLNEGACIQAATTGTPVLVADVHHSRDAQRWPIFAAAVAEQTDVRALFAFPLQCGDGERGRAGPVPQDTRRVEPSPASRRHQRFRNRRIDAPGRAHRPRTHRTRTGIPAGPGGTIHPAAGPRSTRPPASCSHSWGSARRKRWPGYAATPSSSNGCSSTSPATW